jgi:hypothetical protein
MPDAFTNASHKEQENQVRGNTHREKEREGEKARVMASTAQEELLRTQQYLAEVIDECVFVERQRELMERRLTSHIDNQKTLLDDAFGALESLCHYTALMELAVLQSILASLPTSSESRQNLLRTRTAVEAKLERLTKKMERKNGSLLLLPSVADGAHGRQGTRDPSSSSSSSLLTPAATAAGAQAIHELIECKGALLDALTNAAATANAVQTRASSESGELQALRARMDELTRLVEAGAVTPAGHPPTAVVVPAAIERKEEAWEADAASKAPPSAVRFAQARVLAYEKTAQALNNELALLHENYAALARASALEIDRLKQKNIEAQRKHGDQVAECDAVLGRLSLELEQLIQENAQLKQKLRAIVDTST